MISNCVIIGNASTSVSALGSGVYGGTIWNSLIASNQGQYVITGLGGGVALAKVFNSTLSGNAAGGGGGAYGCTLSNCTLSGNSVNSTGGGAWNCYLISCLICSNYANYDGGGASSSTLVNCALFKNTAVTGAGGGAYGGMLTNCLLYLNTAHYGGGACGLNPQRIVLVNCTIVSNSASVSAGGAYIATLDNCILYYNSNSANANFQVSSLNYCCTWPLPDSGAGNITNEPMFVSLVGNDFHLQSNSPCINSGNNAFVTVTNDFDGNPRIRGGTVDIGAYEYQTPSSILSYAWAQQYGLPTDGSVDYLDLDGTGMNNWQKWIAGLNPTNAASVLALKSPSVTVSNATITWNSVTSRTYYVQRSSNLSQPLFSSIQSNIIGQVGTTSFKDTTATNGNSFFYRVGVQ